MRLSAKEVDRLLVKKTRLENELWNINLTLTQHNEAVHKGLRVGESDATPVR